MSKLIVANWKANPLLQKEALDLARKTEALTAACKKTEVVVAPPFIFLPDLKPILRKVKLGAQDAFWLEGPHTGEISVLQLKKFGIEFVIIGHSERRIQLGETDEIVNEKVKAALAKGLKTILCVGETIREEGAIPEIVGVQLKTALRGVLKSQLKNLIVAYEPIWAVSSNPGAKADTPSDAHQALLFLKKKLSILYGVKEAEMVRIIYGGSVNSRNVEAYLREGKMQGVLVGQACLDPEELAKMLKIANRIP